MRVRYAGPGEGTTGALSLPCLTEPRHPLSRPLCRGFGQASALPALCTAPRALSACSAQHKSLRRGRAVSRTLRRTASRLCSMGAAGEHRAALPPPVSPPKKNGRKKGRTGRLRPPPSPQNAPPCKKNARPVCRSAHHHYPAEKPGAIRTYCLPARRPADSSP